MQYIFSFAIVNVKKVEQSLGHPNENPGSTIVRNYFHRALYIERSPKDAFWMSNLDRMSQDNFFSQIKIKCYPELDRMSDCPFWIRKNR